MNLLDYLLKEADFQERKISDLSDTPSSDGMSAAQLKAYFDYIPKTLIAMGALNGVINLLAGTNGAANIGAGVIGITGTTVQEILESTKNLIDNQYTKSAVDNMLEYKAEKSFVETMIKSVSFDAATGTFTFTEAGGAVHTFDTALEKVAINFGYDSENQSLILQLADGSTQSIFLSEFITANEIQGSDTIQVSTTGGVTTLSIKNGSITDSMLASSLLNAVREYAYNAEISESNAAASEVNAKTYANNAKSSEEKAKEASNGAMQYAVQADNSARTAANSALASQNAQTAAEEAKGEAVRSAGLAALDRDTATRQAESALNSANSAKESAKDAKFSETSTDTYRVQTGQMLGEAQIARNEAVAAASDATVSAANAANSEASAQAAKEAAEAARDEALSGGKADEKVAQHNVAGDAHNDIRLWLSNLETWVKNLLDADDETLNQTSEMIEYMKDNRELIEQITTGKVSVTDIINNLTTNVVNKPLSAAQGVALKGLIDALQTAVNAAAKATDLSSHTGNGTVHITAAERTKWNKAVTDVDGLAAEIADLRSMLIDGNEVAY